ncbi:MAG: Gfo/Idh/MocA family oxidoreductase [Microbacterium sp.]|nr:Gfo/Idh/MocA family oxidoreductase [Microbacterium sp.]
MNATTEGTERRGVAIVGTGAIAVSHATALRDSEKAALRVVCDLDADRARAFGDSWRVAWTADLDEVLGDDGVDAVIVCTPNRTHEAIGRRVLEAGKHLLMEKPLAMSHAAAEGLARLADGRGLSLVVGHIHRHTDQGVAIRDLIASGGVGEPRFVRITMNGGWLWGGWDSWVLDPTQSGGHALHNGVHLMDLANWWIGAAPERVFAAGQHVTSSALAIHDYLTIQLSYPGGAAAICEISRAERPRDQTFVEVRVVGTDGVVERRWDAEGLVTWGDSGSRVLDVRGPLGRAFLRQLDSFVDAMRDRSMANPPPRDAVAVIALAEAATRSAEAGRVVTIGGDR